jgi:hypothetical protein
MDDVTVVLCGIIILLLGALVAEIYTQLETRRRK